MAGKKIDKEQMTLDGRVVHARPSSVSKKSPKKVISRKEFEESNKMINGTTLLNEEEQKIDAAKDRKPKVVAKEAILNPDTTVLGNDNFLNFEVEDVKPKVEKPVKVPRSAVEKKTSKKPKKLSKKAKKDLKVVSRTELEKANIADDKSTTVLAENITEVSISDERAVKKSSTNKVGEKPKAVKKPIIKKAAKKKKTECKLIRLSNKETVAITKDGFVVGKSKHSDYQINGNNTVSRSHVIFHITDKGNFIIEDNDSKNGTCVDGVYLKAHEQKELKDEQTIRLSDEVFRVKIKG